LGTVALGLIAIVGSALWLLQATHQSTRTSGIVTSAGYSCSIVYRDGAGRTHTYFDEGGKIACGHQVGDRVSVYYDPNKPGSASLSSSRTQMIGAVVLSLIGLVFVLMGPLARMYARRQLASIRGAGCGPRRRGMR
jgi:hypothetical protein